MKKVETTECPIEGELNYMQEEIVWLAEDIINHSDALWLHAERLYYLEENCFWVDGEWGIRAKLEEVDETQDELIDSMVRLVDIIDLAVNVAKSQNAVLEIHDNEIRELRRDLDNTDSAWRRRVIWLFIWNVALTIWVVLSFWL